MHPGPLQHPRAHPSQHSNTLFPLFPQKYKKTSGKGVHVLVVHRHRNFDTHQPLPSPAQIPRPPSNLYSYFYLGSTSTLVFSLIRLYLLQCQSGTNDEQLHSKTSAGSEWVYLTHFPPKSAGTTTFINSRTHALHVSLFPLPRHHNYERILYQLCK